MQWFVSASELQKRQTQRFIGLPNPDQADVLRLVLIVPRMRSTQK